MMVARIEIWPNGDRSKARTIGVVAVSNDGTGSDEIGNYDVVASHAGKFLNERSGSQPYKTGRVFGFRRSLSPYRLLCRALTAIKET